MKTLISNTLFLLLVIQTYSIHGDEFIVSIEQDIIENEGIFEIIDNVPEYHKKSLDFKKRYAIEEDMDEFIKKNAVHPNLIERRVGNTLFIIHVV